MLSFYKRLCKSVHIRSECRIIIYIPSQFTLSRWKLVIKYLNRRVFWVVFVHPSRCSIFCIANFYKLYRIKLFQEFTWNAKEKTYSTQIQWIPRWGVCALNKASLYVLLEDTWSKRVQCWVQTFVAKYPKNKLISKIPSELEHTTRNHATILRVLCQNRSPAPKTINLPKSSIC